MMQRIFKYGLPTLVIICAAVFCFKPVMEPDTWWQLAAGRYIIHHGIITTDVFSYTYAGKPWMNIKWGYEVLAYVFTKIVGVENLPLLQWLLTLLLIYTLWRTIQILSKSLNVKTNTPLIIILFLAALCGMAYRFNARPESITHLFTALFILLNIQYTRTFSKQTLAALCIAQLAWANMHDAYVLGWMISSIFALTHLYNTRNIVDTLKHYGMLLAGLIIVTCINPYGLKLLIQPLNTFNQFNTNTFTYELKDYTQSAYWQIEAYIALVCATILVLTITWLWFKDKQYLKKSFALLLPLYIITCAFIYLALKAQRNIVFVFIPVTILSGIHLSYIIKQKFITVTNIIAAVACISIWMWVASGSFYNMLYKRTQYGLFINAETNPVRAAEYLVQNNLTGKRFFNDYLSSSYILYGAPGFKSYIDLRDQDVFPDTFIATAIKQSQIPAEFAKADSQYHFDGVILLRNQFKPLHAYLYTSGIYTPVFGDYNTIIYLRKSLPAEKKLFTYVTPYKQNSLAKFLTHLFNPFFAFAKLTPAIVPAHEYYSDMGDNNAVNQNIIRGEKEGVSGVPITIIKTLKAEVYFDSSAIVKDSNKAQNYLALTHQLLIQAWHSDASDLQVNLDLCTYYSNIKKWDSAIYYGTLAYSINKYDAVAISTLANTYTKAANSGYISNDYYEAAVELDKKMLHYLPDDPNTLYTIGQLYAYLQNSDGIIYLQQAIDTKQLSPEQQQSAEQIISQLKKQE